MEERVMSEACKASDEQIHQMLESERRRREQFDRELERVREQFAELQKLLVVAFDGGGIRGLFQAHVLRQLEDEVTSRLGREFRFEQETWLAAGTSTGGILAAGLATTTGRLAHQPRRSAALIDLYTEFASEVFTAQGRLARVRQTMRAKHDPGPLEAALEKHLGHACLQDARPRVLIPAYSEKHQRTWWFDTNLAEALATSPWRYEGWKAPDPALVNPPLHIMCRATSAAPTFFPPAYLEDRSQGRWIDGGVGANNPTLAATQSALAELRQRRKSLPGGQREAVIDLNPQILVLSLGNGVKPPTVPPRQGGLMQWAPQVPRLFMNASATANEELATELAELRERTSTNTWEPMMRYFRIAPPADAPVADMDDTSKLDELQQLASKVSQPQTGKVPATPFQEAVSGSSSSSRPNSRTVRHVLKRHGRGRFRPPPPDHRLLLSRAGEIGSG